MTLHRNRRIRPGVIVAAAIVGVATSIPAMSQFSDPKFDFVLPQPKPGENWQPGVDYFITADEKNKGGYTPAGAIYQPVKISGGKVVVTYFFQYTWPPDLEKALKAWAETQPYIVFVHRPSVGWIHARTFARMHYALKALGHDDDLHFRMFEWVRGGGRYEIYHGDPLRPDEAAISRLNVEFAKENGIDEATFRRVYDSPEVLYAANLAAAESHAAANGGNPAEGSVLINGKYLTSAARVCHAELMAGKNCPEERERLIRLIAYLATDERERAGR
jgi:hypothetical protein